MSMNQAAFKKLLCAVSVALALWALYGMINQVMVLFFPLKEGAIYPVVLNLIRCVLFAVGAILLYRKRNAARWTFWINAIFSTVVAGGAYAMYKFVANVPAKNLEKHAVFVKAIEELWVRPAICYMLISIVLAVLVGMVMKGSMGSDIRLNSDSSAAG